MDYSNTAMGSVIREHRQARDLSQAVLGRESGYGAGAGVAISRIEGGLVRPDAGRLGQIAKALDVPMYQLIAEARNLTESEEKEPSPARGSDLPMRERFARVQRRLDERVETIEELGSSLNENQARARDEFFLPFIEIADQVDGAPEVDKSDMDEGGSDADQRGDVEGDGLTVHHRVRLTRAGIADVLKGGLSGGLTGAGVGSGAAFATFSLAAAYGTASTGTAISALAGAAASNATFAFIGGGSLAAGGLGVAGGTAVLTAVVAAPAALLAIGGAAIWALRKRSKATAQLVEAEAQLDATEDRYQAMATVMRRSDAVLRDIGLFAARALQRWQDALPADRPLDWGRLTPTQHEAYEGFLTIAACHIAVAAINYETFMKDAVALPDLVLETGVVLTDAEETLRALV